MFNLVAFKAWLQALEFNQKSLEVANDNSLAIDIDRLAARMGAAAQVDCAAQRALLGFA